MDRTEIRAIGATRGIATRTTVEGAKGETIGTRGKGATEETITGGIGETGVTTSRTECDRCGLTEELNKLNKSIIKSSDSVISNDYKKNNNDCAENEEARYANCQYVNWGCNCEVQNNKTIEIHDGSFFVCMNDGTECKRGLCCFSAVRFGVLFFAVHFQNYSNLLLSMCFLLAQILSLTRGAREGKLKFGINYSDEIYN